MEKKLIMMKKRLIIVKNRLFMMKKSIITSINNCGGSVLTMG